MTQFQKSCFLALALICGATMQACGQKGELYLPSIPPAPSLLDEASTGGSSEMTQNTASEDADLDTDKPGKKADSVASPDDHPDLSKP